MVVRKREINFRPEIQLTKKNKTDVSKIEAMTPFSRRHRSTEEVVTSLLTIDEEQRDLVTDISPLSNLIGNIKGIFSQRLNC